MRKTKKKKKQQRGRGKGRTERKRRKEGGRQRQGGSSLNLLRDTLVYFSPTISSIHILAKNIDICSFSFAHSKLNQKGGSTINIYVL